MLNTIHVHNIAIHTDLYNYVHMHAYEFSCLAGDVRGASQPEAVSQ